MFCHLEPEANQLVLPLCYTLTEMSGYQTRALDESDWAFADSEIEHHHRELIRPLTTAAASQFWHDHVSADLVQRHPMLLRSPHWIDQAKVISARWELQMDDGPIETGGWRDVLQQQIQFVEAQCCYFVAMRERAICVPWKTLVGNLSAFLRSDNEAPIICALDHPGFIVLSPSGGIRVGVRAL
jgi:hypothetical protein